MNTSFETAITNRADYHAEKYAQRHAQFGSNDVLPMWVADMDLATPSFILKAIQQRLEHPVLGYTQSSEAVYQAIIDWQARHGYTVKSEHIVFTHNVLNGFYMAVQALTQTGDAILVQPPVYPPFMNAPTANQRKLVEAPLHNINNRYQIDFAQFETRIIDNNVKLFLFCHPQNPSGRVWLREELEQIAEICLRHHVIIVSDEIHADMVYTPHTHIPMASLSDEIAQQCVTLSSPGKTFNLGGLQIGYAIIANPAYKKRYRHNSFANGVGELNLFAQIALLAAYSEQGLVWKEQLLEHFSRNIHRLNAFFASQLPKVKVMLPDASYLVWLDFNAYFSNHAELKNWLINDAKLGLNDGESFGGESKSGTGFMRINLAIAPSVLEQALSQLQQAIKTPTFINPETADQFTQKRSQS